MNDLLSLSRSAYSPLPLDSELVVHEYLILNILVLYFVLYEQVLALVSNGV